jgi:hypothetical protein
MNVLQFDFLPYSLTKCLLVHFNSVIHETKISKKVSAFCCHWLANMDKAIIMPRRKTEKKDVC